MDTKNEWSFPIPIGSPSQSSLNDFLMDNSEILGFGPPAF